MRQLLLIGKPSTKLKDRATQLCPWLIPILTYLQEKDKVPVWWARLLKDLGSSTAASSWFHVKSVEDFNSVRKVIENGVMSFEDFSMMMQFCPVIYNIIRKQCDNNTIAMLKPMLFFVIEKALAVYTLEGHERTPSGITEEDNGNFPCLPLKYKRGSFTKDKGGSTEKVCSKTNLKQKSLAPGIFTLSCSHG